MDENNRSMVKSDETLLSILRILKNNDAMKLSEIATEVGHANSTVYDHLATMENHGFILKSGKTYRLGLRFVDYGITTLQQRKIYNSAREQLDKLANEINETALLIVEEQGQAVYLYRASSPKSFQAKIQIGQYTPLHHLAAGKAILAHLPEQRTNEIIKEKTLRKFTDNTMVDPDNLKAEFKDIQERGYALNLEESIEGLHAVSVPVKGGLTGVAGAVSVSGPAHRLTKQRIEEGIADKVLSVANEIELNIRTNEWKNLPE